MSLTSDRARLLRRWRSSLKVIQNKVCELWLDRSLYQEWRAIIDENDQLDKSSAYISLFERNYWSSTLVGIRTFDDRDNRSHSLLRLICEISEHSHLLTEEWFFRRFRASRNKENYKLQFKRDWSGHRTISKRRICKDVSRLLQECKSVRLVVNRHIAHNSRKARGRVARADVDMTLDTLFSLVSRYYLLLFNSQLGHPMDILCNPRIFDIPWRRRGK